MFGLGAGEIFLILAFALIFIGPKKLPELARSLGKGVREFQNAKDELLNQVQQGAEGDDDDHDDQKLLAKNQDAGGPVDIDLEEVASDDGHDKVTDVIDSKSNDNPNKKSS